MSLKVFSLYFAQGYKVVVPILFVPLFLSELGAEQYGLIAFYTMLAGWLALLDAGISGAFIRLVSTSSNYPKRFERVVRIFGWVALSYVLIAFFLVIAGAYNSDLIARAWLKTNLNLDLAVPSITLIFCVLGIGYIKNFISGFLSGLEQHVVLSLLNVVQVTFTYASAYIIVIFMDEEVLEYFYGVVVVAALDLAFLAFILHRSIKSRQKALFMVESHNKEPENEDLRFSAVIKFSLHLSGLSLIWVVASNIDKLVLSKYMPLSEYAYYQIAVQVSAGVALLLLPLTQFLLPRLSALHSEGRGKKFEKVFVGAVLGFLIITLPVIPYFIAVGEEIIALWLGEGGASVTVAVYAKWLVSAAYFAALSNFVFILLYSKGQLRSHFIVYSSFSMFTIPLAVYVAKQFGAEGAVKFSFTINFVFFVAWAGFVFYQWFPKLNQVLISVFSIVVITVSLIIYLTGNLITFFELDSWVQIATVPILYASILAGLFYKFKKRIVDWFLEVRV